LHFPVASCTKLEEEPGFVINQCEQKTALLSITAVYVLNPLQLATRRPHPETLGATGPRRFLPASWFSGARQKCV